MPRPQRPRRRVPDAPISTSTPSKPRSSALDHDPMLLVSPPVMSSTPAHVPAPVSTRALRDISNSPTKKQQLKMSGDDVLLKSAVKTARHNHNVLITTQPDKERVDNVEEDQNNEEEIVKDADDIENNAIGADERNKYAPIRRARPPRSFPSTTQSDPAPTSATTLTKTTTPAVRIDTQFQLGSDDDPFGFKQVDQSNIIPSFAPQPAAVVVPAQEKNAFGGVMSSPISGVSSSPALSSTPARFGEPEEFEEPTRLDSDQSGPDSAHPFSKGADSAADRDDALQTNDALDKTASVTVVSVSKLRFPRNNHPRSSPSAYQPPSTDELLSILPARKYVPPVGASKPKHSEDDDNDEDENGDLFSSESDESEVDEEDIDDVEYGSRPRSARLKRRRGRAPAASRSRGPSKKSKPAVSTTSTTIDAAAEVSSDEAEPSLILPQDNDSLDAYTEQMKAKFAEIDKWELMVETVSSEESLGL